MTGGVFPFSNRTLEIDVKILCEKVSRLVSIMLETDTYLSYEVLCDVAEVVRPWNVRVVEEICLRVLGLIAIPNEELEQVEQP